VLKTLKETVECYNRLYRSVKPNDETFKKASELWDTWETAEFNRPDIGKIINANDFNRSLFKEIIDFIFYGQRNIIYLPFILNDYNYSAFTASDGYVILCDEKFDYALYFIVVVCTFMAENKYSRNEKNEKEEYLRKGIIKLFINEEKFDFYNDEYFSKLLKSSYNTVEYATYMCNAIKTFMFCHELGHHALGHTSEKKMCLLHKDDKAFEYEVDSISIIEEYRADDYAFEKLIALLEVDEKRYYTFFKYRLEYAPLLFFDICHAIDKIKEAVTGVRTETEHRTHPNPHKRRNKLRDTKEIRTDETYFHFRDVTHNLYKRYKSI